MKWRQIPFEHVGFMARSEQGGYYTIRPTHARSELFVGWYFDAGGQPRRVCAVRNSMDEARKWAEADELEHVGAQAQTK